MVFCYDRRRGYVATISERKAKVIRGEELKKTIDKKGPKANVEKPSWIPDPKTGYYRPDTRLEDTGRSAVLNEKN